MSQISTYKLDEYIRIDAIRDGHQSRGLVCGGRDAGFVQCAGVDNSALPQLERRG